MPKQLGTGLIVVVVSVAAATYIFLIHLSELRQEALLEAFKFLLFTGATSGLLMLYRALVESNERRKRDRLAVEAFRQEFLEAYHRLKMVRRDFRFVTRVSEDQLHILDVERFANSYHTLNGTYVDFELLRKSISGTSGAFNSISSQIEADMRSVDKYIRKIMIELEGVDWKSSTSMNLDCLELFYSFLYTDGNPVHVAASKSLDRFLVLAVEG